MSENISYINSIKITLQHNVPETLKNVELWRPNLTLKKDIHVHVVLFKVVSVFKKDVQFDNACF